MASDVSTLSHGYDIITNTTISYIITTTTTTDIIKDNIGGSGSSSRSSDNNDSFMSNISSNTSQHDDVDNYYDNTNPRLVNGSIVLLLLIGNLLGNSLVFYIYRFKIKKSVFSFFVTILAVLDLITALTTMLMDVLIKMRPLDEDVLDLNALCKLTHFQVYTTSLVSGSVLTLIAYQRYRKICHPLKPALKMQTARFILLIMLLLCILLNVCTLIINGPMDIKVKVDSHVVSVTICRFDKDFQGTILQQAFSYLLLSAFAIVLTLTIGYYLMVAKALRRFERRNSSGSVRSPGSPDIDMINQEQGFSDGSAEKRRKQYHSQPVQYRMSVMSMGGGNERISTQMYKVFTIITAVFVISYLPHLVVLILTKSLDLDNRVLTYSQRFALEMAYNCPYISTVSNPIVYGFRSAEFREHCKSVFTCRRWRRRRAYKR